MKIHHDLEQMRRDFEAENARVAARWEQKVATTNDKAQYWLRSKSSKRGHHSWSPSPPGKDPDTYSLYKRTDELMEEGNPYAQTYDYGSLSFREQLWELNNHKASIQWENKEQLDSLTAL